VGCRTLHQDDAQPAADEPRTSATATSRSGSPRRAPRRSPTTSRTRERTRSLPGTGTSQITYDPTGNVATATDAGGTVTYGYDDANQLTSVT
jgi:YD repeat-containing protein